MASTWVALMGAEVKYGGGRRYQGRYLEAGSPNAEALLCLHGQGGHVENFSRNVVPYGQHFHTFALDAAWHGLGPQPPFDPRLTPVLVDQVLDFMDGHGIASAHIEGQSMGAWTAMRLAYEHPERVKKLVLTTATGFLVDLPEGLAPHQPLGAPAGLAGQLAFLQDPAPEAIRQRMLNLLAVPERLPEEAVATRRWLYSRPELSASLQDVVRSYMGGPEAACAPYVMTAKELGQIRAETLVYWGEKNWAPPVAGERLAAAIPGARYHCNPDTGHWAQFEHADEHNRVVLRFLTGDATLEPQPNE